MSKADDNDIVGFVLSAANAAAPGDLRAGLRRVYAAAMTELIDAHPADDDAELVEVMVDEAQIKIRPIRSAPAQPGCKLGPCLLFDAAGAWRIGRWNGDGWFDYDGLPVRPLLWALLPAVSSRAGFLG